MSSKILVTKYIPEVVPNDLKLCERDGLLTYNDQLKYERFTHDPEKYLKKAEVFNFEMLRSRCRRDKRTFSDKYCQTVFESDVQKMSQKERKKSRLCLFAFSQERYFRRKNIDSFSFFR